MLGLAMRPTGTTKVLGLAMPAADTVKLSSLPCPQARLKRDTQYGSSAGHTLSTLPDPKRGRRRALNAVQTPGMTKLSTGQG